MKIRAAVLEESGLPPPYAVSRPLQVREVELDGPGQGEVLVQIAAAGLCHSDLSVIDGNRPRPLPMVLGHEAAGVVEAVGPGVADLRRGDHVVCVFVPSCGTCEYCCEGRPALCIPGAAANGAGALLSGQRRLHALTADGGSLNHHLGVSAFAEYAIVARQSLVRIDPGLDFKHAALFGCAVLTGVGAALNGARVTAGSVVAVIGLGGVGMAALLGARAAGAERIVAIDISPTKLEWARSLGATDTFLATEDNVEQHVRDASGGGVESVLELAGSVKALTLGYRILRRGGSLVTAGLPPPQASFAIPAVSLVADEKTVRGSYLGSCVPARDIPRYVRLFQSGKLPIERLLTREFGLADINAGFDKLRDGELLRGLITGLH
jgi:alcohol dehydrogenase